MEKIRPLFIAMTPVRNEAWVLHAFLKTTSTWADFIIIADQMSTDGSRDIYKQYEKVSVFGPILSVYRTGSSGPDHVPAVEVSQDDNQGGMGAF